MRKPLGLILYSGPSMLDGSPIVAIMPLSKSTNSKTGDMLQTHIIRADMHPLDAISTGQDSSICGSCPLRGGTDRKRSCYVNVGKDSAGIYLAYKRGRYVHVTAYLLSRYATGRAIRIGSYGDPAAVPAGVWRQLTRYTAGHTGYTHQTDQPHVYLYRSTLMASAETEIGAVALQAAGYRTFRVRGIGAALMPGEIDCPSSRGIHCADCQLCSGSSLRAKNISIEVHGSLAGNFAAN